MTTTVINIADAPAGWEKDSKYVFIGRPSRWGNPFRVQGEHTRNESIQRFANHLAHHLDRLDSKAIQALQAELREKILVCYCKPKRCHGDVLAAFADRPIDDGGA
jgi:hypothetical protein